MRASVRGCVSLERLAPHLTSHATWDILLGMSKAGQKIIAKIETLPEADREAVESGVLEYIDWLTDLRAKIAAGEADIAAGRVKPAREVLERLLTKYAST